MLNKIALLVLVFVGFLACDDGDIEVSNFNFSTAQIQICNNVLYKINAKEMLLLDIPTTAFKNDTIATDSTIVLNINATNKVIYRLYTINASADLFCRTIAPADFKVEDEWNALEGVDQKSGLIQIKSRAVYSPDDATLLIAYNHEIRLLNVLFTNGKTQFVFDDYLVGVYQTTLN